jgi:hypothetical protein
VLHGLKTPPSGVARKNRARISDVSAVYSMPEMAIRQHLADILLQLFTKIGACYHHFGKTVVRHVPLRYK